MEVLQSPNQFYRELLAGLRTAQRSITVASLYLGTGAGREAEFAAALAAAAHDTAARPHLRVTLLLDALRCTRPTKGPECAEAGAAAEGDASSSSNGSSSGSTDGPAMTSTAEMLATQLLEGQQEGRVSVSLFHTPALRGLLKR